MLARLFGLFDHDVEKRKEELEKKKRQAREKAQLPPLQGYHSEPSEMVHVSSVMPQEQVWLWYFQNDEGTRNRHGVATVEGKWKIIDQELFDKKVDETKRIILRPVWKK